MNERTIFLNALEIPEPAQREVYLNQACAGDASLRQNVGALLKSHEEASGFLEKPAVEQMETSAFALETPAEPPTPTDLIESQQAIPAQAGTSEATHAEPRLSGDHDLSFLAAPTKSCRLGRLGHYEIHEVIGKGGFGTVLKAFDEKLHRIVAIKVLSPAYAAVGSARKRFIREAQTAAAVKNEHVVAIYSVQDEAQPPYLVMELIDGISLQDKLDKKGPLSVKEILRIGLQTAEGLAAAHKQGLVHRDIKPANILLENGVERVKITDFGLARAVDDASITQSGTVAGTPMYMSPEQAEGLPIDHRSDLFSLGTVLYAMCTGHPAFRASGTHAVLKRVIDASPRPIRELNNEIPDWLCAIIAKLHAKKVADRFQSAKEVAELLGQHLAHLQQPDAMPRPAPVSLPPRGEKPKTGRSRITRVGAVLVVGAIVVALVFASPFLYRYVTNQSTLIFSDTMDHPTLDKILVKQQGETVVELSKSNPMAYVPAGDYEAEVVCKEGNKLTKFRVSMSTFTSGSTGWQQATGQAFPLCVARGDHVSINVELEKTPAGPTKTPPEEPGWVQLFNGTDLDGWTTKNTKVWKVENGHIVGTDGTDGYLQHDKAFGDFHCRLELRLKGMGDFGFRTAKENTFAIAQLGEKWFAENTGSLMPIGYGQTRVLVNQKKSPVATDTWFTLEVIAKGKKVTVKVNGTTTAEKTLERMLDRGFIDLKVEQPDGRLEIRKIEIKELPPTLPPEEFFKGKDLNRAAEPVVVAPPAGKAETQAFVILSGKGIQVGKFDTLAEAVRGASDGDTIEIRGNGPFVTSPIEITRSSLTIRAGEGFRPVIEAGPEGLRPGVALLSTKAPLAVEHAPNARLVLEGLEFRSQVRDSKAGAGWTILLYTLRTLHVANCRFLTKNTDVLIQTATGPLVELRNCEFLCPDAQNAIFPTPPSKSGPGVRSPRLVVDNCLVTAGIYFQCRLTSPRDGSIRLTGNTFNTSGNQRGAIRFVLNIDQGANFAEADWDVKALRVEASGNLFETSPVFEIGQVDAGKWILPPDDAKGCLARMVGWRGERNLYPVSGAFLGVIHPWPAPLASAITDLVGWRKFWETSEANSVEGRVRSQRGDILARLTDAPEKLTPDDFRLRSDSAGYRAGKDGKDLGANVELVGPGAACERWKKTPEYQQWLKDTGQASK